MINTYKKGSNVILSNNFTSNQFDCTCDQCKETLIDSDLVDKGDKMVLLLGTRLNINSGYRCAHKQQMLKIQGYETSKGISQHQLGKAMDISNGVATGMELAEAATLAGFRAIGRALHWVHVDLREDADRRWFYKT